MTKKRRLVIEGSEEKWKMIQTKMTQAGTTKISLYARKMLIDGYVIRRDFGELKTLTHELSNLARSINQIALRVNETRSIYAQDVEDLRRDYGRVKSAVQERIVKIVEDG